MKKAIIIIIIGVMSALFYGCFSQTKFPSKEERRAELLEKRTDRLIKKCHKQIDTVYIYDITFSYTNVVWYNKDNHIHYFQIYPYRTKHFDPIESVTINVDEDISKYFENFLFKEAINCFESVLDGTGGIELNVKNKKPLYSCIDLDCLFKTRFKQNSFPFKLQYEFYKLRVRPVNLNFEELDPVLQDLLNATN